MKTVSSCQKYVYFPIILSLPLLALIFLLIGTTEFRLPTFFPSCHSTSTSDDSVTQNMMKSDLRILVGVLTTADSYERRQLIRLAYSRQQDTSQNAEVDVRFVLCNLSKEEQGIIVALEIMQYDDIIILNCTEC